MQNRKVINKVVVVEGHSDTNKLKKLFVVETIETNGTALNDETINLIKLASKTKGVILLLDPDGPGESIRKKISEHLDDFENIFIPKHLFNKSKKIGVAETSDDVIIKAFDNLISFSKTNNSLTWNEYLSLNLNTKLKRKKITDHFNISESNNKQLFKWLNMMGVDIKKLNEVIDEM